MKHGFDIRIVSYEHIHSIHKKDWNKLLKAINPQPNEIILDGMCGYGAVGKRILEKENSAKLFLLDESKVQMKRAEANLPEVKQVSNLLGSTPTNKASFL